MNEKFSRRGNPPLIEAMTNCLLNQELLNTIPENCRQEVIAHWVELVMEYNGPESVPFEHGSVTEIKQAHPNCLP